jgi:putative chitinase
MDQADPNFTTLLGDTAGILGVADWGAPLFMGGALWSPGLGQGSHGAALAPGAKPAVSTLAPAAPTVTAAQLKKLFSQADDTTLDQVVTEVSSRPMDFALDSRLRLAHFLAQVREEAGPGLKGKSENLNYRPDVLKTLFGYYKRNPEEADQDGRTTDPVTKKVTKAADQQAIANKAYGGRLGNGDAASGDGWKYRGRGFIQVTGRANYTDLNKQYTALYGANQGDFVTNPELLETFPYTLRSAICFWVGHALAKLADGGSTDDDVDKITAVINRDTHSYAERRSNFVTAYAALE